MCFQDLYAAMTQTRDKEKAINPVIFTQIGKNLTSQLYATSPLQFNIYTNGWVQAKEGPKLQFWEKVFGDEKKFVVSAQIQNPDGSTTPSKREFRLEESIIRLVEEFPNDSQVDEIVKALLLYEAERKDQP